MLKISVFYLIKQKGFIHKKKYDLGRSQYQNRKALFTDPIFSDGFEFTSQIQGNLLWGIDNKIVLNCSCFNI